MRTAIFMALVLLSPLTILLPFSNSTPLASTTDVTYGQTTTATYTSASFEMSVVSATGTMTVQSMSIPHRE